ncbi:MAG: hypothetical protein J7L23_00585, partial [Candidatus Diapherotrites archaeon]|nr:hypothetical protein [Candidatus Diapherotrites archaeon]
CCVDVNSDGQITLEDSELIANYTLGRTNCFPAGYSCSARENCDNNKDDDCDGLIDCSDDDCESSSSCVSVTEYNCVDGLPAPPRRIGDVNGDGSITVEDAQIITAVSSGDAVITDDNCCADVDADGDVDDDDALLVSNFGSSGCFPAGYSCAVKELCFDGIDNDCDNFTDTVDSDCCSNYGCADLNGDGIVDGADYSLLQSKMGQDASVYDINADGVVDNTDLNFVSSHIGDSTQCSQMKKCPDVRPDGTIDLFDVTTLASHYPSCATHGPYSSAVDITNDGNIDNGDFLALFEALGKDRCSISQCIESTETNCTDGIDNDCDTFIDCNSENEDPDCNCPPGPTSSICLYTSVNQVTYDTSNQEYSISPEPPSISVGNLGGVQIIRGFIRWDISSIPDDATITNVNFTYYCPRRSGVWGFIKEMTNDPAYALDEDVFNDCGDGPTYGGGANIFPIEGANNQIVLNSDAVSKLQSQLRYNWFAIGLISSDESLADNGYTIERDSGHGDLTSKLCVGYVA